MFMHIMAERNVTTFFKRKLRKVSAWCSRIDDSSRRKCKKKYDITVLHRRSNSKCSSMSAFLACEPSIMVRLENVKLSEKKSFDSAVSHKCTFSHDIQTQLVRAP